VAAIGRQLAGGAIYANMIWPGMKWKYAYGQPDYTGRMGMGTCTVNTVNKMADSDG